MKRDNRVDIIKSIGIILVVLGHTQMRLCSFVNLFHVGLFFIASGFCFQEKYTDNIECLKEFFFKRVKRLYLPFVLWNIFFLCFRNLFCEIGIYSSPQIGVHELLSQGGKILLMNAGEQLAGACWFVRALFLLEIVFVLVDFTFKKICDSKIRWFRIAFAIVTLAIGATLSAKEILLPYNASTVLSAFSLFVIGIEIRGIVLKTSAKSSSLQLMLGRVLGGGIVLTILLQFGTISYDSNNYPNVFFFILAALAGWMMCWGIAELVDKYAMTLGKALSYIGKRTLEILFLHLFSFKVVSLIIIFKRGLELSNLSAFPVLDVSWWPLYLVCGVFLPLLLSMMYEKITAALGKKVKVICMFAIIFVLLIVPNILAQEIAKNKTQDLIESCDFTLVYDKESYLSYNKDILQALGEDDEVVFEHFLSFGMKEGRRASEYFDVWYYRDHNGDLGELFGDDMEQYYIHYMQYGYKEGRKGSDAYVEPTYPCGLIAKAAENNEEVILEIILSDEQMKGKDISVYSMPAYSYEIGENVAVYTGKLDNNTFSVALKNVTDKYVVATKTDEGYKIVSNYAYIQNPEEYSTNTTKMPTPRTKKGLQVINTMQEDIELLNPSHIFMNMVIENIMYSNEVEDNTIVYEYKGKEYYFRKDVISKYDKFLSRFTEQNVVVTASVISIKREGFEQLYYPDALGESHASYYALNTTNQVGLEYVEAFVTYMSSRYNGTNKEHGIISNWVVGNEVNESGTYNYMGEKEIGEYLEEYTRTFRIIYNIVKTNIPEANVYVPMEPWWGIDSDTLTYGGREFLDRFNSKIKSEGNIDWGVAYHAYSFPLSDPKVLNDTERTTDETGELTLEGYVTTDSIHSVTITMENIDVLTEYMHEEKFLTKDGEVRSIILSEQGYTSNSNVYGACEAQQAASMVYAYYKSQMNEDIDAFIYFVQRDDKASSLNNSYYQFGLWSENQDGSYTEKMSHDVFQIMDTKESLSSLSYIEKILGITSWESVIPYFDNAIFNDFISVEELDMQSNERYNSKKLLDEANVSIAEFIIYTGKECMPDVAVYYNGVELKNDVDYDVVYLDNVEIGEATVLIVGMGDYAGIQEVSFEICAE